MSRVISTTEFFDTNVKELLMPDHERKLVCSNLLKEYGTIEWKCFNTGHGISYCNYENMFYNDTQLEGIATNDYSFLAFNLGDFMHMKIVPTQKEIKLNPNLCFSGSMHEGHKSYGLYAKERKYSKHFIIIENQLFQNFVLNKPMYQPRHPIAHYSGEHFSINTATMITNQQLLLLNEISQAGSLFSGSLQEIYLESKILELTYNFFETNEAVRNSINTHDVKLSYDDIKSLEKAKKILLGNLQNPPSLKELAYKSAINEFKLKKGFKQLYGTTVYGLLHEHRLQYVKNLLIRNDISIQEAASMVGYHSMGHFSKIFKEKYGIFPMQIKKNKALYF